MGTALASVPLDCANLVTLQGLMPGCVSVSAGFKLTQLLLAALGEGTLSRPSACMDRVSLRGLVLLGWGAGLLGLGSSLGPAAMSCAPVTGLDCCCVGLLPCRTQRQLLLLVIAMFCTTKASSRQVRATDLLATGCCVACYCCVRHQLM